MCSSGCSPFEGHSCEHGQAAQAVELRHVHEVEISEIALIGDAPPGARDGVQMRRDEARLERFARKDRVLHGPRIQAGWVLPEGILRKRAAEHPAVTDDHPYTEFPLFEFWRGRPYYEGRQLYDVLVRSSSTTARRAE